MISKEELMHLYAFIRSQKCEKYSDTVRYAKKHGLLTEPEMAWHQRSEEEIRASLDRLGYKKNERGYWTHPIFPTFWESMWDDCGKIRTGPSTMLTEWVELREVEG